MTSTLVNRAKAIREDVNLLERLHKTCQLTELGLAEPVLNESRYLARALADVLYHEDASPEYLTSLQNAEHAARCAINDAIDTLITFVKKSLQNLRKDYPKFAIATCPFGEKYIHALEAMATVEGRIVDSRTRREKRVEIYKDLATENRAQLEAIAEFALLLPQVEAVAQVQAPEFSKGTNDNLADGWLLDRIRAAIAGRGELDSHFVLELQPKILTNGNERILAGAEALLRLHAGSVVVQPYRFIPFAERYGLITGIGFWVARKALVLLRENQKLRSLSINSSSIELLAPSFSDDLLRLVAESGVNPERLELEVTESVSISDLDSEHHLEKLTNAGVHIAIDDFGTGETKFDYLARMRISTLKVDISLVRKFEKQPTAYLPLMTAISAVGKACNISMVAEGVESELQVHSIENLGINCFQGYFFDRPLPEVDFLRKYLGGD